METKKQKRLFVFIWILMLVPLAQQLSGIVKEKSLKGAISESPKPVFSAEKWFEGSYQQESETYLNEKFGFRNYFIRLNNQLAYSLYNKAKANGVIIGKNGYLFEENYIKAYYGLDFVGQDSINSVLSKVLFLQQELKKKNIDVVLVLNPGKTSYYPEYIPDKYRVKKSLTNYEYYAQTAKKLNLNLLDLRSYFITNKNKFPYPLFPKCGIHWSTYCEILAKDTLMRYLGHLANKELPILQIDSFTFDYGERNRDADIKDGMNIITGPDCGTLAYPIYHVSDSAKSKLNALMVADSFYWGIYGSEDISKLFSSNQFWFYYYELYNSEWSKVKYPNEINLKEEIEKQNVIILMATESTLPKLGWGFIEQAYALYKQGS
jgi:SGNH hydrolase-like domain, acetyltransferase AlgX